MLMEFNKEKVLAACNAQRSGTLMETLDIEYIDATPDSLTARMPVGPKVHQPDGVLNGGATVALAESVGSPAAFLLVDPAKFMVRGLEISANHIKSVKDGYVYAKASVVHSGRTTQLWSIRVTNEEGQLVSIIKLTNIVLPRK
jgi:uncharacterized protein (TIGR00369 family)